MATLRGLSGYITGIIWLHYRDYLVTLQGLSCYIILIIWLHYRDYLVTLQGLSGYITGIIWLHYRDYMVTLQGLSGYITLLGSFCYITNTLQKFINRYFVALHSNSHIILRLDIHS